MLGEGRLGRRVAYAILVIAAFEALLPMALACLNALKSSTEIDANALALPAAVQWVNFAHAWHDAGLGRSMLHSVELTATTIVLVLATATPAAYVLARRKIRHWRPLSFYILATTTVPTQLFLYPLYFLFARLGLLNNILGVAVIYTAMYSPFCIFLLRTYVLQIPVAVEEAAAVDGASPGRMLVQIIVPMAWPGLLTAALIAGMHSWNEFLIAATFLQSDASVTAVVRFYNLTGEFSSDWGEIMAAAVLIVLPVVALFILVQRHFIEGMAAGSVKG